MESIIITTRKRIHDSISQQIFGEKGGINFTRMSGDDIEKVFDIYDNLFFAYQIRKKLKERKSILKFVAGKRKKGVAGLCLRKEKSTSIEYIIDVSPYLIAKIADEKIKMLRKVLEIKTPDRVYSFLFILEHLIIHLLMYLWEYLDKEKTDVYSSHGTLYRCVLKSYFGYNNQKPDKSMASIVNGEIESISEKLIVGMMKNWSESCYMDSLLTGLLIGASNVPRKAILESDVSKIDYKSWVGGEEEKDIHLRDISKREFKPICDKSSNIKTEKLTREYAQDIQNALLDDYDKLVNKKDIYYCMDVRSILARCNPDIKQGGHFTSYPVSDLYGSLAKTFPDLQMWYIPAIRNNPDANPPVLGEKGIIETKENFMFSQFVAESPFHHGKIPDWDNINSPMLVFRNSFNPPLSDYGSVGIEDVHVEYMIGESIAIKVEKYRAFSEYILDGRYRLFLVVTNHGRRPSSPGDIGGGHYTAYIRPVFDPDEWYFYNDVGPVFRREKIFPRESLIDGEWMRPELLFYEKVKDLKPLTTGKSLSSKKMTVSQKIADKQNIEWSGTNLMARTKNRPDGYVFLYVKDQTKKQSLLSELEQIRSGYSIVHDGYIWRIRPEDAIEILEKVKAIDDKYSSLQHQKK